MATKKKVKAGEEFVFCTGATAATVAQCRKELKKLTPEQFAHHVNAQRHDIYTWLKDCLDAGLAQKIRDVKELDALVRALGS